MVRRSPARRAGWQRLICTSYPNGVEQRHVHQDNQVKVVLGGLRSGTPHGLRSIHVNRTGILGGSGVPRWGSPASTEPGAVHRRLLARDPVCSGHLTTAMAMPSCPLIPTCWIKAAVTRGCAAKAALNRRAPSAASPPPATATAPWRTTLSATTSVPGRASSRIAWRYSVYRGLSASMKTMSKGAAPSSRSWARVSSARPPAPQRDLPSRRGRCCPAQQRHAGRRLPMRARGRQPVRREPAIWRCSRPACRSPEPNAHRRPAQEPGGVVR